MTNPLISTASHKPEQDSLTIKMLNNILGFGLAAQIGLVFWPIGNYATIVYLTFYLPILIIAITQRVQIISLIKNVDRRLFLSLLALLFWVSISTLYARQTTDHISLLRESLKHNFLIFLYVFGIAYLTALSKRTLIFAIYIAIFFAGLLAIITIIDRFVINDLPIKARMMHLGIYNFKKMYNPVVIGIYFGGISIITAGVFKFNKTQNKLTIGFLVVHLVLLLLMAYMSGTRTALVGLIAACIFYAGFIRKHFLAALFFCALTPILISLAFLFDIKVIESFVLRGGLGSWRPQIWDASFTEALKHPWIGIGFGSETNLEVIRENVTSIQTHSHNFYLQLLTWCGILGLATYLACLFAAFKLPSPKKDNQITAHLYSFSFVMLCYFLVVQIFDVHNIFTSPSYYWPCIWLPFGILLGLSYENKPLNSKRHR
ncbi:MAG: O-antigen ligase family protein [Cellvibrionaceae bacterium]